MEYSSSAALLRYLHGEGKVPTATVYVTVCDRHSIVNKNDDGDMMMMLPAMKDSQVIHDDEEEE